MAITYRKIPKPPKPRPASDLAGIVFGIEMTDRKTGLRYFDTWGFPSRKDFEDMLKVWNQSHHMSYKEDPNFATRVSVEESVEQPVL